MPTLSYEELVARCVQLQADNNATVNQAEDSKKTLDEISAKTWELVVQILSKKHQTPNQAFAELKATGLISEEVFRNIEAGTAGLELVQNIELWFTGVVTTIDLVAYLGLAGYIRFSVKPGYAKAELAKAAAEEALHAFRTRSRYISRVLGPKGTVAVEGFQKQLALEARLLAATEKEALAAQKLAKASRWSKRVGKFGLWALAATLAVAAGTAIYNHGKEKKLKEETLHALHEMYTSRFYMTVQLRYLQFLVHHVSQVHDYATLVVEGQQAAADILLKAWVATGAKIDPATGKVDPASTKKDTWSEETVKALLAANDVANHQKLDADPDSVIIAQIHEEQLKRVHEQMNQEMEKTKADVAAGKSE